MVTNKVNGKRSEKRSLNSIIHEVRVELNIITLKFNVYLNISVKTIYENQFKLSKHAWKTAKKYYRKKMKPRIKPTAACFSVRTKTVLIFTSTQSPRRRAKHGVRNAWTVKIMQACAARGLLAITRKKARTLLLLSISYLYLFEYHFIHLFLFINRSNYNWTELSIYFSHITANKRK